MRFKVFISGNQKELNKERLAVKEAILENAVLRSFFDVFIFEELPAKGKTPVHTYLKEVDNSDIYIGIIGNKYGIKGKDGYSPTEREFRRFLKIKKHKNLLFYIKGKEDSKKDIDIKKLIKPIREDYIYKRFKSTEELKNQVVNSLIEFLREEGFVGKSIFDETICKGATWKDIDSDKVKWFLRTAKEKRNFPLPENAPIKDVFIHLNLLNAGKLTNAAILLFGKNPHKFHLQAETKCLQFSGTEVEKPFPSYHIYSGNLFDQVDRAVSFVLSSIKLPVIQQEHTAQVKRPPEIPLFAVEEAIVNALAHRSYNDTSGVQVMVFIDRVEIWNSGRLPAQLTIDDLKKPHRSFPGNPLIAEVFYLADYIQKVGSGTIEMIKQCKKAGLPEPEFVNNRGYEFRTILGRDIFTESVLANFGLNERQLKAVKLIKEKGSISLSDLKKFYPHTADRTLNRDFQALVEKGILKAEGEKKGRRYKI